jgi:hypothetical protein
VRLFSIDGNTQWVLLEIKSAGQQVAGNKSNRYSFYLMEKPVFERGTYAAPPLKQINVMFLSVRCFFSTGFVVEELL